MFQRGFVMSAKGIIVLLGIIGSVNLLIISTTASTSVAQSSGLSSNAISGLGTNLLTGIEQFLAPSGYAQARQDPSFAVHIPFSDLGTSPYEPGHIAIPSGMGVIWFNDDDSDHSVTFNSTSPEAINSGPILPGGFFIHRFTTPGTYGYYDNADPSVKGTIKVGSEFESGRNMDMLVGGNNLPFQAGKVGRTTFSFVPHSNVITIPPTLSVTYAVSISNANGTRLYANQFDDSDGILDLELIPTRGPSSYQSSSSSSSAAAAGAGAANQTAAGGGGAAAAAAGATPTATSNQTSSSSVVGAPGGAAAAASPRQFITWGPDLTDQQGVASDGVYHVQGPVLTQNEDYTINVSIVSVNITPQPQGPSDSFMLTFANSIGNPIIDS
jgi:plastocyanin